MFVFTHSNISHSYIFQLINCPLVFLFQLFHTSIPVSKCFTRIVNGPENLYDCKWQNSLLLMVIAAIWLNEACRELKNHVLWWMVVVSDCGHIIVRLLNIFKDGFRIGMSRIREAKAKLEGLWSQRRRRCLILMEIKLMYKLYICCAVFKMLNKISWTGQLF